MSFFSSIASFFGSIAAKVRGFLGSPAGRVLRNAVARFLETLGPIVTRILTEMAEQAVADQMLKPGKGTEKKIRVFDKMKGALLQAGHEVADKDINFAIEAAVQALRGKEE